MFVTHSGVIQIIGRGLETKIITLRYKAINEIVEDTLMNKIGRRVAEGVKIRSLNLLMWGKITLKE